jgi:hypothetical protein
MKNFQATTTTIVFFYGRDLPFGAGDFQQALRAAVDQDLPAEQVIVVDSRGPDAKPDFLGPDIPADRIAHVPGAFANRAAACNAGLQAVTTDFAMFCYNQAANIIPVRAALRTFVMAATRQHQQDMVYADYELIAADGQRNDVHLLDWHPGRLRDTVDFGSAIFYRTQALRDCGGFNEQYQAADLYDLRLRISAAGKVAHVANRYAGSLYSVNAPAKQHNVFDYLLAGKDVQLEMERACSEHLKRTGAYLQPGAHFKTVAYTDAEQQQFQECVASVVIPVNNRPEFIGRAIESIQAQTVKAVEAVIVVNGGSDDPTVPEVRRYLTGGDKYDETKPPVQLITLDVNNLGVCLNTGISAARGKYYVQLDSDDRLKPDAVEKILAVFDSDPHIGMVVGSYEVWTLDDASGQLNRNAEIPVVTHDEWTDDNGRNNLLRINGAGAPRAAHIKVIADAGWFGVNDSPQCRNYGEDYDLVLRISERYQIGRVWDPIYEVIRHAGGTDHAIDEATVQRNDNAKDAMRIEALHRRTTLNQK